MTHLLIYRLRKYNDLESIVEELSAIFDKKTILQIYNEAVSEEYSFLYVNWMSKDKHNMFMERSQIYLIPSQLISILKYSDDDFNKFRR